MSVTAPLRVPVELRRDAQRWFRMTHEVSAEGLLFAIALPVELGGEPGAPARRPIEVLFQLPDDDQPIRVTARAVEVAPEDDGDRATVRAVRFVAPEEPVVDRIARYVAERVPE